MTALFEKLSEAVCQNEKLQSTFGQLHKRVQQHPEWEWNVEETAKELNFSSSHFQRIYRSLFGASFKNDVITSRIKRACMLLSETDYSVSKIGELCGYHSDKYFVRQFQQITGVTPLKYRKSIRKGISSQS